MKNNGIAKKTGETIFFIGTLSLLIIEFIGKPLGIILIEDRLQQSFFILGLIAITFRLYDFYSIHEVPNWKNLGGIYFLIFFVVAVGVIKF